MGQKNSLRKIRPPFHQAKHCEETDKLNAKIDEFKAIQEKVLLLASQLLVFLEILGFSFPVIAHFAM